MLWVFGYGSLVWKPPAGSGASPRQYGYIEGYRRVWHQQSTDHRGTPEFPGTVVTLVAQPGSRVWGVASLLTESDDLAELARIKADLDHREKQYDTRLQLDVLGADGAVIARECLAYVGTPAGENWAGERPLREIAENIAAARGPSGPNDAYLFNLCEAFRTEIGAERAEPELFELERLVRSIQAAPGRGAPSPLVQSQRRILLE